MRVLRFLLVVLAAAGRALYRFAVESVAVLTAKEMLAGKLVSGLVDWLC
jgi:hypothetical protein